MANVLQQMENVGVQWTVAAGTPRSLPAPVVVGSRVVAVSSFADGGGSASVLTVVDDGGTIYAICKRQPDATVGDVLEEWSGIATSVNAGQNVVITQSTTGTSADDMVALYEVGNPDPAQVFDGTNTNGSTTGSSTSHDSGNVTPGTTDSVIIAVSRGGSRAWTPDADFINDLTNNRTTLGFREQAAIAATSYTITSDTASFASIVIVAFNSAAGGTSPIITNVDGDDAITSTQTGWDINGSLFDAATVEIRQDSVQLAQDVNSQDADTINCDIVFDPGAPGNGPHLKYGAALCAVINSSLEEDTHPITVAVPAGRAYANLTTPNPDAPNRITAISDLAAGDQLEIFNVVGGTIADVTVNPDATFNCAETVESFGVRCWDAGDETWGAPGTQYPGAGPAPAGGGVVGPGVSSSAVVGPFGVSP